MRLLLLFSFAFISSSVFAQKMLLLERANRAKTTKYYVGDGLRFRLVGEEDYWYTRTITDILPESNTLMLDNFAVELTDIQALKVRRAPIWRILGSAFFTLGGTLAFATTVGRFGYQDKEINAPKLYAISAASLGTGWLTLRPRKLKLGQKHRLRIIEVSFPPPIGQE